MAANQKGQTPRTVSADRLQPPAGGVPPPAAGRAPPPQTGNSPTVRKARRHPAVRWIVNGVLFAALALGVFGLLPRIGGLAHAARKANSSVAVG